MARNGFCPWIVLLVCLLICQNIDNTVGWLDIENMKILIDQNWQFDLMSNLNYGVSLVCGPLTYGLTRRLETRFVIIGALVVALTSFAVAPLHKSFYFCLILQVIINKIARGCVIIGCVMTIGVYFDQQLPLAACFFFLGRGIFNVLVGTLFSSYIASISWHAKFVYTIVFLVLSSLLAVLLKQPVPAAEEPKESDPDANESLLVKQENEPRPPNRPRALQDTLDFFLVLKNWKLLLLAVAQMLLFVGYIPAYLFIPMFTGSYYGDECPKLTPVGTLLIVLCSLTWPICYLLSILICKKIIAAVNLNPIVTLGMILVLVGGYFVEGVSEQYVYLIFFIIRTVDLEFLYISYLYELAGRDKFPHAVSVVEVFRVVGQLAGFQLWRFFNKKAVEEETNSEYVSENSKKYLRTNLFILSTVSVGVALSLASIVAVAGLVIRRRSNKRPG